MTIYGDINAWIILFGGTESIIGDTNTNTSFDDLSGPEVALCRVGMLITGNDIPLDTYISAIGPTSITLSQAATGTTNDVTATIQDALYLKTDKQPVVDSVDEGIIDIKYPGRGKYGFQLVTEGVNVKILNSYCITKNIHENTIEALRILQDGATQASLRIQDSSAPTYMNFGGTGGNIMPVIIKSFKGRKKMYGGNSTIWEIGIIQLIQVNTLITV